MLRADKSREGDRKQSLSLRVLSDHAARFDPDNVSRHYVVAVAGNATILATKYGIPWNRCFGHQPHFGEGADTILTLDGFCDSHDEVLPRQSGGNAPDGRKLPRQTTSPSPDEGAADKALFGR